MRGVGVVPAHGARSVRGAKEGRRVAGTLVLRASSSGEASSSSPKGKSSISTELTSVEGAGEGTTTSAQSTGRIKIRRAKLVAEGRRAFATEEDWLYHLGKKQEYNVNIEVGAKRGNLDSVFIGASDAKFVLGSESDIASGQYRRNMRGEVRQFNNLVGNFYISPVFMDRVAMHVIKNLLCNRSDKIRALQLPLILGIWGGKGVGKTFQTELILKEMGVTAFVVSAGELESEKAGSPARMIWERYREASMMVKEQGKPACLFINDLDAGIGLRGNTQNTVNTRMIVGSLMQICDRPYRDLVAHNELGAEYRIIEDIPRIPIIVSANDLTSTYAPLWREGRMSKFYYLPTRIDKVEMILRMLAQDGLSREDCEVLVDTYPDAPMDFFGAMRARCYDEVILKFVSDMGGPLKSNALLMTDPSELEHDLEIDVPVITLETLLAKAEELQTEQRHVEEANLADEYTYGHLKAREGGNHSTKNGRKWSFATRPLPPMASDDPFDMTPSDPRFNADALPLK